MVITKDPDLVRRVKLLRGYGLPPEQQEIPPSERHRLDTLLHEVEGYNLRLDSVQAAILRVKLRHLRAWQAERSALAERYAVHFTGTPVQPPAVRPGCTHAWRNYIVRIPARERVRPRLREQGIATNTNYIPPVHLQPVYRHLGLGRGSFPVAEREAQRLLGLPLYPGLDLKHVDEVAAAVLDAVAATAEN